MIRTFSRMLHVAGSKKHLITIGMVFAFLAAVAQGLAYAVLFPLVNALLSEEPTRPYLNIFVCLVVLDAVFRFVETKSNWLVFVEVADESRVELGNQLKRVPLEKLAQRTTGDLSSVLTGNVADVVAVIGSLYTVILNTIVAPSVTIIAVLFIDYRIALAMLAIFPMAIPIYRIMRANTALENRIVQKAHADVASDIIEYTQGLAVLRANRQVGQQSKRLQQSIFHLHKAQLKGIQLNMTPSLIISTIVQIGIVCIAALAIYLYLNAGLSVSVVLTLFIVTLRFSEPLSLFANMASIFDLMEAALERIDELLSIQPLETRPNSGEVTNANIDFDSVTFRYENTDTPVISHLSLHIPQNSFTALVGSSGSGKTTLTKLLTRYADPQQGHIRIGGIDIASLDQYELMRNFSVVFQDVYLFDDTIYSNIRLGKPSATDTEIEAAAIAANCHEFIQNLPNGYETTIGEIGGSLSGGERQRISIARAILKDAPIVILDEPTSALDTESEVAVQRAIDALVKNKTVIVIAHRLSTIVAADQIVVLENGSIIEDGEHFELLQQQGRYWQLWQAQQSSRHWQLIS